LASSFDASGKQHQGGRGGAHAGPARQRAYRSARSHSGRVRVAKVALPVIAIAAIMVTGAWMWLSRVTPDIGMDISGTAIRGGKLVMANPKLDGLTSGDRPYSVRAARAIQDLTGTGAVDLERLQADVPMNASVNARIRANAGLYNSESNTLDLRESITVETTDGMRAELESAAIDLQKGNMSTADPVRISLPGAVIEADRMTVEDNGRRLVFENRVKLVVEPGQFKPADSPARPAAAFGAQTGN
jgi:lipopolysaccharide export system protein LptC